MRLLRRRGLLSFALLPLASLAAPTTVPANFASATLLAFQIVLGSSSPATKTIHAARVGEAALLEVVPLVCQRSCSDYLSFEPPCMQLQTEDIAFCKAERIDQFVSLDLLSFGPVESIAPTHPPSSFASSSRSAVSTALFLPETPPVSTNVDVEESELNSLVRPLPSPPRSSASRPAHPPSSPPHPSQSSKTPVPNPQLS
ncbi:hypothetical protein BDY24DRAFT_77839 [Mrakia frigida]|uniref:uncharacterized protein n=1 Tax=Mrakia frigida TaxID=29902 RepID=UPI003FCBEEE1